MTHWYVWHYSFVCGTWLIHMWGMSPSCLSHNACICVTWLIHIWNMTHSYVGHDSCTCVPWLIHMCDMTHSCAWHDSSMCVTELSCHTYEWVMLYIYRRTFSLTCPPIWYEWVMSHIWMSHVTHMNESCHTREWVMSHIRMSHVTHMNESCNTLEWVMSHVWMSNITHMSKSYHTHAPAVGAIPRHRTTSVPHTYDWVISSIWTSHITHINTSCHTGAAVCHDVFMCVICHSKIRNNFYTSQKLFCILEWLGITWNESFQDTEQLLHVAAALRAVNVR